MFRQNTSSPKTWSLTCCKKWTWRRDASKFGELILWVACCTKTLLSTRIKAFHIFPHTVASNAAFRQKYVLSEKDCLCPVIKNSSRIFDATKLWKHTIPLTYITKTLISNISETHRFSPQMRLIAYPDHKTTLKGMCVLSTFGVGNVELVQIVYIKEFHQHVVLAYSEKPHPPFLQYARFCSRNSRHTWALKSAPSSPGTFMSVTSPRQLGPRVSFVDISTAANQTSKKLPILVRLKLDFCCSIWDP